MMKQAVLFLAAILVPGTLGYGTGAPAKACESLQPGHYGITKQTSESPYSIAVDGSEYKKGTKIAVTINGGDFQGILLQARKADGSDKTPIGTFTDVPDNTKTTQCTAADDSFTHANTNAKNKITVQWNPPSQAKGDVKFYATVAREKSIYWMDISSDALSASSDYSSSAGPIEKSALLLTLLIPMLGKCLF